MITDTGMMSLERCTWSAPDGTDYRVSLHEFAIDVGLFVRRRRRIEFESVDGRTIGSAPFPGYHTLELVNSDELEELWRHAVGE